MRNVPPVPFVDRSIFHFANLAYSPVQEEMGDSHWYPGILTKYLSWLRVMNMCFQADPKSSICTRNIYGSKGLYKTSQFPPKKCPTSGGGHKSSQSKASTRPNRGMATSSWFLGWRGLGPCQVRYGGSRCCLVGWLGIVGWEWDGSMEWRFFVWQKSAFLERGDEKSW